VGDFQGHPFRGNQWTDVSFAGKLQEASGDAGLGFHFEEGALQSSIGGDLVVRDDFKHAYVRVAGKLYDWQGEARPFKGGRTVTKAELIAEARDNGVAGEELEGDVASAKAVIGAAKEKTTQTTQAPPKRGTWEANPAKESR
jgi:hypothetical protein